MSRWKIWFAGCEAWIQVRDIPGIYEQTSSHSESKHLIPPFEAYSGDMPFIFVSYAHKDSERVFAEITRLHESGYKIWYDEGIEASSEWPEEIANAVIGCAVFLVFISPNSTASVNCRNEINLALNENKPFLAIHLDESELPPGLRLRMGDLQAILQYKLPADRYNKKLFGSLDQLLGKKKKKAGPKSSGTTSFAQTSSNITSNPKRKKRKLNTSSKVISIRPASKSKLPMFFGWCIALLIGVVGTYKFLEMKNDPGDDLISSEVNHKVGDKILVEGQPWTSPSSGIELIWCKPGTFLMGSPESEMGREEDENQHQVTLSKGFFLGKFEVTQSEFEKIMKRNPSKYWLRVRQLIVSLGRKLMNFA